MFDRTRQYCVRYACKGASQEVLRVAECSGIVSGEEGVAGLSACFSSILSLECTLGVVECAKLYRNTCSNANQRRERAFVERCWAFILEDLSGTIERAVVLCRRL